MENGRITDYVKKYPQTDRINLVSEFASPSPSRFKHQMLQLWDVLDGLHHLHSCKIVHGDLNGVSRLILL